MLLVVDNCEHVIDDAAELAQLVTARCPQVRVLSTSREPLALHGERVFPIGSLAMPSPASEPSAWSSSASVRLFLPRRDGARLGDGHPASIEEPQRPAAR
jgi:predicted ATPase